MKEKKITVLYVEPGKKPKIMTIDNTLKRKQELVEGFIEYIDHPLDWDADIIVNEEGKIYGLEPNRAYRSKSGEVLDFLYGPFIIVGNDGNENCTSLTKKQIEENMKLFEKPEMPIMVNDEIVIVSCEPEEEDE